jgi:hypothetical protein
MSDERLLVNPILCDTYGHCAEVLPEMIERAAPAPARAPSWRGRDWPCS